MRHAIPVEDFLLLLCPDAIVLVQKVQERTLGFFKGCIGSRLEVSQIGENALLELLRVLHWASKGLETERETPDNIGARDVEKVVPAFDQYSTFAMIIRDPLTIEHKTRIRQ